MSFLNVIINNNTISRHEKCQCVTPIAHKSIHTYVRSKNRKNINPRLGISCAITDVRRHHLRVLLAGNDDKNGGDGHLRQGHLPRRLLEQARLLHRIRGVSICPRTHLLPVYLSNTLALPRLCGWLILRLSSHFIPSPSAWHAHTKARRLGDIKALPLSNICANQISREGKGEKNGDWENCELLRWRASHLDVLSGFSCIFFCVRVCGVWTCMRACVCACLYMEGKEWYLLAIRWRSRLNSRR